jgi:hypothetical protein
LGRKESDEGEHGAEPGELSRRVEVGATAINAGDTRVSIEEPVQGRIQTGGVEDSRGAEKRQVTRKLFERVGDEKRIGKSSTTKRSSREGIGLDDNRCDRKQVGMGSEGKRDGAELGCHGEPCNGTIRKKDVAAGTSAGRWCEAGIGDRQGWRRTKADREIGKKSMVRIRSRNCGGGRRRKDDRVGL